MIQLIRTSIFIGTLALMTLLSGCGGEKTNITGDASSTVQACSSLLGVTCVSGRLIDDAASNVDYQCGIDGSGTVRSLTAIDGGFSCPSGSVATFFLANPASTNIADRIVLGSVTVTRPAMVYGSASTTPIYFYVTPRTLAGDSVGSSFSVRALNIARLMQTLSTDTTDAGQTGYLPSRRVVIDDADKRKILASVLPAKLDFSLPAATDPVNPEPGSFDATIAPYLQSLADATKHQLIPSGNGYIALEKGSNSTVAGVYLVPGSLLSLVSASPSDQNFDANSGSMVGVDFGSGKDFAGGLYMLVDRRGRTLGNGVYSYGVPSSTTQWQLWSDPQPLQLTQTGNTLDNIPLWPLDNNVAGLRFALLGSSDVGKYASLTQGVISRQAVAGSAQVYTNLFAESSTPSALGQWSLVDGSGATFISGGAYTLERTQPVAPLMNPDLWNSSVVTFPLPITVSLYNSDYSNASCGSKGCKIADIRMVVLQDGNIISDRFGDCGANVDPKTLLVGGDPNKQELPLGTVANILNSVNDETTTPITTMTLLSMLPNDTRFNDTMTATTGYESYIPYIQFGSNLGDNSLLRVDGVTNKFNMYGFCTSSTPALCSYPNTFQPGMATWVNAYSIIQYIKANQTAPNDPATLALKVNKNGLMSAQRTPTCP